jgi:hypothetical protein
LPGAIVAEKGTGAVVWDVGSTVPAGQTTCATVEKLVVFTVDVHRLVTERTSVNCTRCPGGLVTGISSPNPVDALTSKQSIAIASSIETELAAKAVNDSLI